MAFAAYVDDSDAVQSSVITLAGYMASLIGWERYEEHSRRIYDRFEIGDVLHAKEFHGTKPPFKTWTFAKKLTFLDLLFENHPLQWGVAVSISKKQFAAMKEHPAIGPNMSPFGLAFGSILHTLVRGNPIGGIVQAEGLSVIVESGHRNSGDMERTFHHYKKHEMFSGALRTISFDDKNSARALHLADLLAFYSRRHHSLENANPSIIVPYGRMLKKLASKLPHSLKLLNTGGKPVKADPQEAGDAQWFPVPLASRPQGAE